MGDLLKFKIRRYIPKDKDSIMEICAETGFLGAPIDPIFSDRKIFSDMICCYYLRYEPNHAFVAEINGKVIGYLIGSTKRYAHLLINLNRIKNGLKAVIYLLSGKYKKYPQNKKFLTWLFTRATFEIPKHPYKAAHLHFNIKEGYRNKRIGSKLLNIFYDKIHKKGIKLVYEEVFAHGEKPEEYFKARGFKIYDKKITTMFKGQGSGDVYLICIVKDIS